MTGFDVLKAIRHPSYEVIFTTSYDEYAIEAIKNNALDYLVKPVLVEELLEAVAKARVKLLQASPPRQAAPPPPPVSNKFGFPITTGMQFYELSKLIYAKAEDNVAQVYMEDNTTIKLTKTLSWLEEQLESNNFCRIHHSYLINLNHMKEYIRNEGGFVVMSNKKAISISRRRKDTFLAQMEEWNRNRT